MQAYNEALKDFRSHGIEPAAVSPMTELKAAALSQELKLGFPLLRDANNTCARRLGLVFQLEPEVREIYLAKGLNLPEFNGETSWELPVTAVFLLDRARTVRFALTETDYTRRPDPEELWR